MIFRHSLRYLYRIKSVYNNVLASKRARDYPSNSILIAEYPKCGGTFALALLTTIVNRFYSDTSKTCVNHKSVYLTSFDIDQKFSQSSDFSDSPPVLLKTHARLIPRFFYQLCIFRDPLSCFVSYYNMYLSQNHSKSSKLTFECFLDAKDCINQYKQFYNSYLLDSDRFRRIQFVSYEELIHAFPKVVSEISICMLGIYLSPEDLGALMSDFSKPNFKKVEDIYATRDFRRFKKDSLNTSFISNRSFLDEDDVNPSTRELIYTSLHEQINLLSSK